MGFLRCPECDSAAVERRPATGDARCHDCGAVFGRCPECGSAFDRPSRYDCLRHPAPTPAMRAAFAVCAELSDRRIRWDDLDDDLCDQIEDALAARIEAAYHAPGVTR